MEVVKVNFDKNGLAGMMYTTCTHRCRKFKGHKSKCGHDLLNKAGKYEDKKDMLRYAANLRSAIGNHISGLGYYNAAHVFQFLEIPYIPFKVYQTFDRYLGEKGLEVVSLQVREEVLKEDISFISESYATGKYGEKPALAVSLYMGRKKVVDEGMIHHPVLLLVLEGVAKK